MKKQFLNIVVAVFVLIIFTGCPAKTERVSITVGKDVYKIEVAVSREEQATGLMNREKIEPNVGMIFVYKEDRKLSFWMKNTLVPLSIAYIAKDGTIKEIYHMKPESLTPINSTHSVRYALELPLGSFEKSGSKVGDIINIPEQITDY